VVWEIGGGKDALVGVWMTWGLIEGTGRSSREEGEPKKIGQKCVFVGRYKGTHIKLGSSNYTHSTQPISQKAEEKSRP
jgi:hypothetical protein